MLKPNNMRKNLIFVFCFLFIPPASAWTNYAEGITRCGEFISAMDSYKQTGSYDHIATYIAWRNGFMTALGMAIPHDFGKLNGTENYLENYCRAKPLNNYMDAVIELSVELRTNR